MMAISLLTVPAMPAAASTGGCYGSSCNGKDPTGLCDDGITVASKRVQNGFLELRYSKSCKSNWGRYTLWSIDANTYDMSKIIVYARVTVWNPGGTSYELAHKAKTNHGTSWSKMVDGTKEACTGVEVITLSEEWSGGVSPENPTPANWQDKVWNWGPCY